MTSFNNKDRVSVAMLTYNRYGVLVDDATGQDVEVVSHVSHNDRVSGIVATLERRRESAGEEKVISQVTVIIILGNNNSSDILEIWI